MTEQDTKRPPAKKREARDLPRFVPVIFANGEDDDAPGVQAAFDNEAVQFDERIYEPDEDIVIVGRTVLLLKTVRSPAIPGARRTISFIDCLIVWQRQWSA